MFIRKIRERIQDFVANKADRNVTLFLIFIIILFVFNIRYNLLKNFSCEKIDDKGVPSDWGYYVSTGKGEYGTSHEAIDGARSIYLKVTDCDINSEIDISIELLTGNTNGYSCWHNEGFKVRPRILNIKFLFMQKADLIP